MSLVKPGEGWCRLVRAVVVGVRRRSWRCLASRAEPSWTTEQHRPPLSQTAGPDLTRQKRGSAPSFVECNVLRSVCGEDILVTIHGAPCRLDGSDEATRAPDQIRFNLLSNTWDIISHYYVVYCTPPANPHYELEASVLSISV